MIKALKRELKKNYLNRSTQNPNQILEQFSLALQNSLQHNLKGLYVIGSYGLNDFNQHLSDIDFIVVLEKELNQQQIAAIHKIHLDIERVQIQPNLNGIYILDSNIGKTSPEITRLTYFHEGELKTVFNQSNYYEINPITWAELKLNALTIFGKPTDSINLKIDWKEVDQYLFENINSYWKGWLEGSQNPYHPYYYMTFLRASENAWCVSGVARQVYTLEEQKITSKRKACEYLIDKFPSKFEDILKDTINYRKGLPTRKSWFQKRETLQFLEYSINYFNELYNKKYFS